MEALEDPSMWKFISPIVISFALLGGMGYVAIKIVPRYLEAAMKGFFFFFFFFVFQCFVSCTLWHVFGPFCGEKYVAFFRSRFRQYFVFREIGFSKNPKLLVFCFVDMCFKVFINFLILNCFFFCFCFSCCLVSKPSRQHFGLSLSSCFKFSYLLSLFCVEKNKVQTKRWELPA